MKRLIIDFAAILIALPLTAQRRVSKRSSEKERKKHLRKEVLPGTVITVVNITGGPMANHMAI